MGWKDENVGDLGEREIRTKKFACEAEEANAGSRIRLELINLSIWSDGEQCVKIELAMSNCVQNKMKISNKFIVLRILESQGLIRYKFG